MSMLLDERRKIILGMIEVNGFASLQQLAEHVGVSESTVRRDLEYLDGIGQIRRTRGGAAYIGESLIGFEERAAEALTQKQRIAQAAAELVQPGEAVLLDGGTTTLEVARHLLRKPLQVVTNSLPIANLLANQSEIELIFIGGYLYPKTGVALGPMAIQALSNIHVRRLIMSVGGINEMGLYNSNALLVGTERQMLESAEEVVVVSDSGKFGHSALAHLCPLDAIDCVVTDSEITDEWKTTLTNSGIALSIVEV